MTDDDPARSIPRPQPPTYGRFMFFLGLALFVIAISDPLSVGMTDEELAENNALRTLVNLAGFYGGIGLMIVGGWRWRRRPERRVPAGLIGHDVHGRPFGTRDQIEAEVNAGLAAKQARLDRIEAVLARPGLDPSDQRVQKLEQERQHLRTFFWLARGGDRRGEAFPKPSRDISVEEADLLAKLRGLDDTT